MKNTAVRAAILLAAALFSSCGSAEINKQAGTETFEIALVGDIMPGRKVDGQTDSRGSDFLYEKIGEILKGHSLIFGNLEAPLVYDDKIPKLKKNGKKQIYLYAEEKEADSLKKAGFDLLSLANNHTMDYGESILKQTMQILQKRGIDFWGVWKGNSKKANAPFVAELNGAKTAFLCYSKVSHPQAGATGNRYGVIPATEKIIIRDILAARKKADIIIVYLHWGQEGKPVHWTQRDFARALVDAGADFVFGSHTHEFQDIEKYRGKYIFYGLGNFVFDQVNEPSKKTAVIRLKIENKKIVKARVLPVYLEEYRPVPVTDFKKAVQFLSGIKLINLKMQDLFDF